MKKTSAKYKNSHVKWLLGLWWFKKKAKGSPPHPCPTAKLNFNLQASQIGNARLLPLKLVSGCHAPVHVCARCPKKGWQRKDAWLTR